jgi:hypothetical protein
LSGGLSRSGTEPICAGIFILLSIGMTWLDASRWAQ